MRPGVALSSISYLRLIERCRNIGTWALQPSTGSLTWSEGFRRLTRIEAVPGVAAFRAAVHPDDRWIADELLSGTRAPSGERRYRVMWPDGAIRWHACSTETAPDARDRPSILFAVVEDVTESELYETHLLRQHRAYDRVIELSGGLSWRVSPLGVVHRSDSWRKFTGQSHEALQANGWMSAVHPDDLDDLTKIQFADLHEGQASELDVRIRRHDNVYIRVHLKLAAVAAPGDDMVDWLAYVPMPDTIRPVMLADTATTTPTAAQLRGCRGLLAWTIGDLAAASGVSPATIARYESRAAAEEASRPRTLAKLRTALENAGIEFIANQDGGVCLRLVS